MKTLDGQRHALGCRQSRRQPRRRTVGILILAFVGCGFTEATAGATGSCRADGLPGPTAVSPSCQGSLVAPALPWCDPSEGVLGSERSASDDLAPDVGPEAPLEGSVVWVYRDPATGRFTPPPAAARSLLQRAVVVPKRALTQRRLARPGGGVRVDVSERFAPSSVAIRDGEGGLHVECGAESLHPVVPQGQVVEEEER